MKRHRIISTCLSVVLGAMLLLPAFSLAKKPDNPGGGGGGGGEGDGGGVIYFSWDGDIHSMNDDGTGITMLTNFPYGYGSCGDPSRELHAGKRWFVQGSGTSLVALSEAGDDVPLDLGSGVEVVADPRWGIGDSIISFEGRWRNGEGVVVEGRVV